MRNSLRFKVVGALVLAVVATGCASQRFVTSKGWAGSDTFYISYYETTGFTGAATKVKKCNRLPDNRMECSAQPEIDAALNK